MGSGRNAKKNESRTGFSVRDAGSQATLPLPFGNRARSQGEAVSHRGTPWLDKKQERASHTRATARKESIVRSKVEQVLLEEAAEERDFVPGISKPKALFMLAAGLSFVMSVSLYFTGSTEQGIFVGIWVPSILSAGALLLGGTDHA